MFFKSNDDFSHLPEVLAGPILRRVERDRVCVWIALKNPYVITGAVYICPKTKVLPNSPHAISRPTSTISLGEHLHIALIEINTYPREHNIKRECPNEDFPYDTYLCYDLLFQSTKNANAQNLLSIPNLSKGKRLTDMMNMSDITFPRLYPFLPTFFIPSPHSPVNFLQGSCRKGHGQHHDGVELLHDVLEKNIAILPQRPSALFLTGDQIYADEVADGLINYIAHLGNYLLGFEETIFDTQTSKDRATVKIKGGERGELLSIAGFMTAEEEAGRNHLIGFGEFAAMYLLAWNPSIWGEIADKKDYLRPDISSVKHTSEPWGRSVPYFEHQEFFSYVPNEEEYAHLRHFKDGAENIRRVFANIPTYMIFDDHEITDDWLRTDVWKENAYETLTGKTLMTNGLGACWAFQCWGNNPDVFVGRQNKEAFYEPLQAFWGYKSKPLVKEEDFKKNKNQLIQKLQDKILYFEEWGFVAPTYPPAIHLDTRTQRHYDNLSLGNIDHPPRLLNAKAIAKLKQDIENIMKTHPKFPLLIISPAPVLGVPAMEAAQDLLVEHAKNKNTEANERDVESWHGNLSGFYDLILMIANLNPKSCVFFSGDVHFSFVAKGELKHRQSGAINIFTQFTASSFKYKPESYKVGLLEYIANKPNVVECKDYIWEKKEDYIQKPNISFSEQSPGKKPLIISIVKILENAAAFLAVAAAPLRGVVVLIVSAILKAWKQTELDTSDYTFENKVLKFDNAISSFVYTDPNMGQYLMDSPDSKEATMIIHAIKKDGKKEQFSTTTQIAKK